MTKNNNHNRIPPRISLVYNMKTAVAIVLLPVDILCGHQSLPLHAWQKLRNGLPQLPRIMSRTTFDNKMTMKIHTTSNNAKTQRNDLDDQDSSTCPSFQEQLVYTVQLGHMDVKIHRIRRLSC